MHKIQNTKHKIQNGDMMNEKKYDLEERTLNFLKNVIAFLRSLHKDFVNVGSMVKKLEENGL